MGAKRRRMKAALKAKAAWRRCGGSEQRANWPASSACMRRKSRRGNGGCSTRVAVLGDQRRKVRTSAMIAELFEQIGRLKMEAEWLKKKVCPTRLTQAGCVDQEPGLSVRRQCELLGLTRWSWYYGQRARRRRICSGCDGSTSST